MRPNHTAQGRHQALFRRAPLGWPQNHPSERFAHQYCVTPERKEKVLVQQGSGCTPPGTSFPCSTAGWLAALPMAGSCSPHRAMGSVPPALLTPGGSLAQTPPAHTVTGRFSCTWASQKHRNAPHTTGALLSAGRSSLPWDAPQPRTTERLSLGWRGALLKICLHFSITNYTFLDPRL